MPLTPQQTNDLLDRAMELSTGYRNGNRKAVVEAVMDENLSGLEALYLLNAVLSLILVHDPEGCFVLAKIIEAHDG